MFNTTRKLSCMLLVACLLPVSYKLQAQSFRKGSLFVRVTEGVTHGRFNTFTPNVGKDYRHTDVINGDRDPLTIEYGISNHWGVGINMGGDIYSFNPSSLYGFRTAKDKVTAITSEFTIDAHYHCFVTKHTDVSFFASVGVSSINFEGHDADIPYPVNPEYGTLCYGILPGAVQPTYTSDYKYNASGGIMRLGAQVKYYFKNRFGVTLMSSLFATGNAVKNTEGKIDKNGAVTAIKGNATEFGLCYRFLKGK